MREASGRSRDPRYPSAGEDGLSLARHVREHYKMGIVVLTSAGMVVDRIVGLEMGADDYILKPFEPRELLARIRSVLRGAAGSVDLGASRVRVGRCVVEWSGWKCSRSGYRCAVRRTGTYDQRLKARNRS